MKDVVTPARLLASLSLAFGCIVLVLWRLEAPNSLVLGYKGRNSSYLLLISMRIELCDI